MKLNIYSIVLVSCVLLGNISCGLKDAPKAKPTANELLHSLRMNDPSIVQVKLQKCLRGNLFEGEAGTGPQFDRFQCELMIERFDPILNQNHVKPQTLLLAPPTVGTPYWTID